MITHRPAGRGHPYRIEPDQRTPVRPSRGEAFELRATTHAGARSVQVDLDHDGERRVVEARPRKSARAEPIAEWGQPASSSREGHLSGVMEDDDGAGRKSWVAEIAPLEPGATLRYRFHCPGRSTPWYELRGSDWSMSGGRLQVDASGAAAERLVAERLVADSVRWLTDGDQTYAATFSLRLEPGEHVVGFGERFDGLDQRGRLVDAVVFDQYKGQGARTYLPSPFAVVVGGDLGFHVDTGHRTRFDVGKTSPGTIVVTVDLEPGERQPELTLRLFSGTPADVLGQYLTSTGGAALPPDWVFRLWISGNEWNSADRVLEELDQADAAGIPVGVVVIEAWSDEETFVAFNGARYGVHPDGSPHRLADFSFPPDGPWPDPKAFVADLHRRGAKVLLWQIPLVGSHPGQAAADHDTMVARGYCVADEDGTPYRNPGGWFHDAVLLDFTNADARRWWLEKRRYLIEEVGVDGFKTDGGEHAWSPELVYADGSRGGESNNRYPVLYGRAYHDLLRSAGRDPVTFSRAGFTGSAAIPCHWAGDQDSTWDSFRASISAGLSAGASGIFFWGWDIAGFSGPLPTPELYLRAAATACFCPIMQCHSEFNHHCAPSRDRTPWNVAAQTGDPEVLRVFRRFVRLRERLVPYLSEQARAAVTNGVPLMRALFFAIEGDERIWDFPEQYFLGDGLSVAPVTAPAVASQRVYVPPGDWVDAWSGASFGGPDVIERPAPISEIPVLVSERYSASLLPLFAGLDDDVSSALTSVEVA